MKSIIKTFIITFLIIVTPQISVSQEIDKTVTITVSSSGTTLFDAKQNCLRDALSQAFGAFVSTNTVIVNDQILLDEINMLTNGNIIEYEVLSQDQLVNGDWVLTLKVKISVNKLIIYVYSKGMKVTFNGSLFALNAQQDILNQEGEVRVIKSMIKILTEISKNSFDFSVKPYNPKSLDGGQKNWVVPLDIYVSVNENFSQIPSLFINTLSSLSLSKNEIKDYRNNKVDYHVLKIMKPGKSSSYFLFYLRNYESLSLIQEFVENFKYHILNFSIDNGIEERERHRFYEQNIAKIQELNPYAIYREKYFYLYNNSFNMAYYYDGREFLGPLSLFAVTNNMSGGYIRNMIGNDDGYASKKMILDFNNLYDKDNVVLIYRATDVKTIEELKMVSTYNVNQSRLRSL